MPLYTYKCLECEEEENVFHGMSERHSLCSICGGKVERVPQNIILGKKEEKKEVGTLVKRHIEETKQEVEEEKKKLREREME